MSNAFMPSGRSNFGKDSSARGSVVRERKVFGRQAPTSPECEVRKLRRARARALTAPGRNILERHCKDQQGFFSLSRLWRLGITPLRSEVAKGPQGFHRSLGLFGVWRQIVSKSHMTQCLQSLVPSCKSEDS